jgi:predicted enzyme related to lactoylglutathione lyase
MNIEKIAPVLPSLNFDATIMFYQNLIEQPEVFRTHDYLILNFPLLKREIHFYATRNAKDGECSGLYLRVNEIAQYHDRAKKIQGRILKTLRDEPWGQKEFCVLDPSGCLLRFGEPILNATASHTILN